MKTLKTFFFTFLFISFSTVGFAQTKTETFKVAGECGMCKKKIESTAKKGGASYAAWDVDSKLLTVKYNSTSASKAKIEKAIASVGYDTPDYKTTEAAYDKLDGCCKYERSDASATHSCCDNAKCTQSACMKDGKCSKDMSCCKEAGCDKKDCCTKS
ncbi:MAG: hypothetical protein JWR72_3591 [Flavisolibacter sp.]|jgi:mercuric ion binding protein|nr:hypothetical protein [Flavisolibacter sp.]